jgi:hypothetical protein
MPLRKYHLRLESRQMERWLVVITVEAIWAGRCPGHSGVLAVELVVVYRARFCGFSGVQDDGFRGRLLSLDRLCVPDREANTLLTRKDAEYRCNRQNRDHRRKKDPHGSSSTARQIMMAITTNRQPVKVILNRSFRLPERTPSTD